MSCRVIIRPEAEVDITEGFDWYEERRDGLGQEFLAEIKSVLNKIGDNPLRHAIVYDGVRRALVRRFPYKIFYYVEADQVKVIGVVHARRHPQFWRRSL